LTRLTIAKLLLAGSGIIVFGYGIHEDDATFRWIGIALIAAGAALRFAGRHGE
jgi:hypothetical protein